MSWFKEAITSSVGKKVVMSLTGLFLVIFLVAHLAGNISLTFKDGSSFNEYAHFMKHNTIIIIGEYIMFAGFLFHIIQGLILEGKNRASRPQNYKVSYSNKKVSWFSKYMGPFGIVILVFLLIHLFQFFRFKYFAEPEMVMSENGYEMADLYSIVHQTFQNPIWVAFYAFSMLIIAFHLAHGFQSAFQSLGIKHKKYSPLIVTIGYIYAILIPLAFAIIPVMVYKGWLI